MRNQTCPLVDSCLNYKKGIAVSTELIGYDEQLLTPKDLSKWLNVKLSTIYKWSAAGYIPLVKLGGKVRGSIRFSRVDIQRWLTRRSRRGRNTYKLEVDWFPQA
jgi:excisionase family DNA binding protein